MAEIETPSLMEDTIEEILLRFPPDDPESLLHAALVCKSWCRLVCSPAFNRRFREFHDRTSPPVLGFFYHSCKRSELTESVVPAPVDIGFMPLTSSFRRLPHAFVPKPNWSAVDERHGRVLLYNVNDMATPDSVKQLHLIVWNPISSEVSELPVVRMNSPMRTWSAALVCDDDSSRGACFRVVLVAMVDKVTSAHVYSSEQHAWSTASSTIRCSAGAPLLRGRNALIGNVLYFWCRSNWCILQFDISKQELSFISAPSLYGKSDGFTLITAKNGGLGAAMFHRGGLFTWSLREGVAHLHGYEYGLFGEAEWVRHRVIRLERLLAAAGLVPIHFPTAIAVAAVNGLGTLFIRNYTELVVIDLKFGRVKKIYPFPDGRKMVGIVPCTSFCTPVDRSSLLDETPRPGYST